MPKLSLGSSEISTVLERLVSKVTKPTFVVGIKREEERGILGLLLTPAAEGEMYQCRLFNNRG
jgi:hypothetical protein